MPSSESIYPALLLISGGLSIGAPLLSWLRGRGSRSRALILVSLGTATITIGAAFLHRASDLAAFLIWARVENIGFAILVPGWLIFSEQYIGIPRWLKGWLRPVLVFYALVTITASLGPPTPITWSNPRVEVVGGQTHFMIDRGFVVWVAFTFTVLLSLAVMALFFRASNKVNPYYRWRLRLVPLAMLLPFYAALHDTFGWQPFSDIRLVPMAFAFFSGMLYFTVVHQRFGDLVPIARDLLLENLYEGVVVLDREGRVVDLNSVTARMAGHTQESAMGKELAELMPALDRELKAPPLAAAREVEVRMGAGEGERIYDGRISPVMNSAGEMLGQVVVLQDVTERKASEERMRYMALHDDLTGLANRAALMDRLSRALERSRRQQSYELALLFIDLDRFKVVNDSLGHAAGDKLLAQVARRLEKVARKVDTVARLGGDEFVLLLEGVGDKRDALGAAERVLASLEKPFEVAGHELTVGASIGFAYGLDVEKGPEANLDHGDLAMYRAKSLGGSQIIAYQPSLDEDRVHLERKLYERRREG
ncbi:MAG: diguanylate cyclase domain-containing protein [Anaerolineales bacterium]